MSEGVREGRGDEIEAEGRCGATEKDAQPLELYVLMLTSDM